VGLAVAASVVVERLGLLLMLGTSLLCVDVVVATASRGSSVVFRLLIQLFGKHRIFVLVPPYMLDFSIQRHVSIILHVSSTSIEVQRDAPVPGCGVVDPLIGNVVVATAFVGVPLLRGGQDKVTIALMPLATRLHAWLLSEDPENSGTHRYAFSRFGWVQHCTFGSNEPEPGPWCTRLEIVLAAAVQLPVTDTTDILSGPEVSETLVQVIFVAF